VYGIRGGYRGFASTSAPVLALDLAELPSRNFSPRAQAQAEAQAEADRLKDGQVHRPGLATLEHGKGGGEEAGGGASARRDEWAPVRLTPALVRDWNREGGSNLATARGGFDKDLIIAFLERHQINQL
jgi:hypothetical protein